MKLRQRSILITGGTSGIGAALVSQLAGVNAEIVVIGRNPDKLDRLRQDYSNVTPYRCALDSRQAVERTIETILARHPSLSVVINNAAVQYTPTLLDAEFSFASIENEITTNLTAPIWISALLLGHFQALQQNAAVINITTGLALFPKTTSAVYCATKAGLHFFSRSLRYQLEATRISVHEAIMPLVDTAMTADRDGGKMTAPAAAAAIIRGVERGRAEFHVGKARLIPVIARISPALMGRIMKTG